MAGNIRSGSIKRCSAAIGEGSMAVAMVHRRLAELGTERMISRTGAPTTDGPSEDTKCQFSATEDEIAAVAAALRNETV